MNIALLTHPNWFESTSMPRFAAMIADGMRSRGHTVTQLTAPPVLSRIPWPSAFVRKWMGYADQFAIFPRRLRQRLGHFPAETLFVVSDQALGMWVPHIKHRPHVVHCHDFLAQRSALGQIPHNPTAMSGKMYQALIRKGFSQADSFISVSHKTQSDLHSLLGATPKHSSVVHNGLNAAFAQIDSGLAQRQLSKHLTDRDGNGFLLHVGGNQWYKNRAGAIKIYLKWCQFAKHVIPLWMIGAPPTEQLKSLSLDVPNGGQVRFLVGLSDEAVRAAYNLASLFLFPSIEEGFGWPIAEAMACGTPVLTTYAAPMTEVGGTAALYHRRESQHDGNWAADGAEQIESYLMMPESEKALMIERSKLQASHFDTEKTLDRYEAIYRLVLDCYSKSSPEN